MDKNNDEYMCDCGRVMKRDTKEFERNFKGNIVVVFQPGWYCEECGDAIFTIEDLESTEINHV